MSNRIFVTILGIVLVSIGIVGYVNNPILGIFSVNAFHNIFHLLTGFFAFLALTKGERGAVVFGKTMAVIYGLLTVLGFLLIPTGGILFGLIEMNTMDHVLHILLTVIFTYIGFVNKPETVRG